VEDDFMIAMDLQVTLERHGWSVMGPVATVQGALNLLKHESPSVALVAEKLKACDVPFVLATAYGRPEEFGGDVLSGAPNVGQTHH
jgi:hypothetical protein